MSEDFKTHLATEILSEQRTITYRNVSRALKVHVNAAKCMLYDFYTFQTGKKPGSVYATYLLCGVKKRSSAPVKTNGIANGHNGPVVDFHDDDDEPIPSSPPPFTSSMLEPSQQSSQAAGDDQDMVQVPLRVVTLVREESLDTVRAEYETVTSLHIYSLSPGRIQDLVALTDVGRGLFTDFFTKQDPLEHNNVYGVIQNPHVRRRTGKRPIVPSGPPSKFQPVKDEPKKSNSIFPTKTPAASSTKEEPAETTTSKPTSQDTTSSTKIATKPALKRDSSDLFKAFAKQSQSKPKSFLSRDEPQDSDAKMSDAPTTDADEGESEDDALFLDTGTRKTGTKKRLSDAKRERDDKAAKLRKMMDSDDEDQAAMPDAKMTSDTKADVPPQDITAEDDGEAVAWSDSDTEKKTQKPKVEDQPTAAPTVSGPRRRRGKRKVMKKRTTKDEEGYLVTKEEAVWESFSEDEPEPAPPKPAAGTVKPAFGKSTQSQSQSQGKAGAKKGMAGAKSGSIMSFFGKKA
ncbi:hypothetical protein B0A52_09043 [Exophiala mesophila]|uniref:DNA polymerase delta subunit 3 n=1 Tax=Exophiala mesophila TaxID=212818 RepID=A0A438MT95_EXOME|nr:hypothetical protein B0A52_09043 [Exophiala mesophila]